MWQGGEGQRGPDAEIDGPLCPPLRPRPGALCARSAETCWVLFPFLGARRERRGVRGPLIRAGRAEQPECRGIIATCSAISPSCRGRGQPRPPESQDRPPGHPQPGPPRPAAAEPSRQSPSRRHRRASAVRVLASATAGAREALGEGRTPAELRLAAVGQPWRAVAAAALAASPRPPCHDSGAPEDVSIRAFLELLGQRQLGGSVCLPPSPCNVHCALPLPSPHRSLCHKHRTRLCRLSSQKQQVTAFHTTEFSFTVHISTAWAKHTPSGFAV